MLKSDFLAHGFTYKKGFNPLNIGDVIETFENGHTGYAKVVYISGTDQVMLETAGTGELREPLAAQDVIHESVAVENPSQVPAFRY